MKPPASRTVMIFGLIGLLMLMVTTIPAWCAEQDQPSEFEVIQLPEEIQKQEIAPGDILNIMLWEGKTMYVNYYAIVSDTGELTLPNDQVIQAADSTMRQLIMDLREIYEIKYPQATMLVTLPRQVDREDLGPQDLQLDRLPVFKRTLRTGDVISARCWDQEKTYFDLILEVGEDGTISIPPLGTIKVTDRTLEEMRDYLATRYLPYYPGSSFEVKLLQPDTMRPVQKTPEEEEEVLPPEISAAEFFGELPLFGMGFFEEPKERRAAPRYPVRELKLESQGEEGTLVNIPVPADYTLGPGDEIAVRAWSGPVEHFADTLTVSQEGTVYLELLGEIPVAGRTLAEFKNTLKQRFGNFYDGVNVTTTIARIRAMDVYITGDVKRPGRYTLAGTVTVFSALYEAGGIAESGSLRNVMLMRKDADPRRVDLYKYLIHGDASGDVPLQSGDTILVRPSSGTVGIAGQVRREARYEIDAGMTIQQAMQMAGGLAPNAYAPNVEVWRISDHARREVININMSKRADSFQVQDGDLIIARQVNEKPANTVELIGAVKRPGTYEVGTDLTVARLLDRAQGLTEDAYIRRGAVWRLNADNNYEIHNFNVKNALADETGDNLALKPDDRVYIYRKDEVLQPPEVSVTGSVSRPGAYPWAEDMKVSDLLLQAQGPLPDAYVQHAELLRTGKDMQRNLIGVNLASILQGDPESDIPLQPGDHLTIYDRHDRTAPMTVTVTGFVNDADTFDYRPGMHVSDAIYAAGGLKPEAGETVVLSRGRAIENTETQELNLVREAESFEISPDPFLSPFDHVAVQGIGGMVVTPRVTMVEGRVENPGGYTLQANKDGQTTLYDVLQKAGPLLDDANPYGIVIYRKHNELLAEVQESDVEGVLQTFNRQRQRGPQEARMLTEQQKAQAMGGQIGQQLGQIFSDGNAVSIVTPPRRLDSEKWADAVPVNGHKLFESEGREGNVRLTDGDVVVVPRRLNTVAVLGAVVRPGALHYEAGSSSQDYIARAGGSAEDAAMERAVVIRANGQTVLASKTDDIRPGNIIVVPSRYLIQTISKEKTWTTVLKTLVGAATALLVF